ncbi:hypothetical protein ACFU0X_08920 [Streptomyces cellulosae]|uniref:Uncharacterized protein n=1 Tax=Streptomyces cellulosae TaxID=1968 RepID=A0ABW6JDJ0_STRCE
MRINVYQYLRQVARDLEGVRRATPRALPAYADTLRLEVGTHTA